MSVKTTKAHFKKFKSECKFWINYFGLKGWEVKYFHEKCDGRAEFHTDISGRMCSIVLNTRFKNVDKFSDDDLRWCAFHEVVEGLLFSDIISLLYDGGYSQSKVDSIIHPVIRTFENTIFKDIRNWQILK